MKKQYYYWIATALVIIGVAVGLFLWKGKHLTGTKAEAPIAEEAQEPQIVLRELQPVKADEENFLKPCAVWPVRRLTRCLMNKSSMHFSSSPTMPKRRTVCSPSKNSAKWNPPTTAASESSSPSCKMKTRGLSKKPFSRSRICGQRKPSSLCAGFMLNCKSSRKPNTFRLPIPRSWPYTGKSTLQVKKPISERTTRDSRNSVGVKSSCCPTIKAGKM